MSKLAAALAWAARGFPVFPLVQNGKEPAFDGTWYDFATTDPDVIRSYWTDNVLRVEQDYNIGVDCTDRIVIDLDEKLDNKGVKKEGINEYLALGGQFDTLTVSTPSGGLHLYYEGADSGNAPISHGIDVRSHHGYVVAPGSTIDGVSYSVVDARDPIWIPATVAGYLSAPYERSTALSENVDTEANVHGARLYLESCPPAQEGNRGDDITFKTAARCVREFGLTVQTAFELMRDVYNPRCEPPWAHEELLQKVENAASYGTAAQGALDPAFLFSSVSLATAPPSVFEQAGTTWGNMVLSSRQTARSWLLDRVLVVGQVMALLAAGSAGKSSWALALAAHLAIGLDFAGHRNYLGRPCKVVVYNGEDDIEEQSRRLAAICAVYGLDEVSVAANVLLLSEENVNLKFASLAGRTPVENEALVKQIIELCSDPDVYALILDPLVDIHDVDESDNPQMNFVLRILKRIAKQANVAVVTMHHVTKAGTERQEARVGNADISRGASAIINKVRSAFTLMTASESDCEQYGFQMQDRNSWVRMDDAKMNFTLASMHPTWFRRIGMRIASGDIIGVMEYTQAKKDVQYIKQRVAELFLSHFLAQGMSSITFKQAMDFARAHEPLWANLSDIELKKRIEGVFIGGVELHGGFISINRDEKDRPLITLS